MLEGYIVEGMSRKRGNMDNRIRSLLKSCGLISYTCKEHDGVTFVDILTPYIHFDKIKILSQSIMFKGIGVNKEFGSIELQFIAL